MRKLIVLICALLLPLALATAPAAFAAPYTDNAAVDALFSQLKDAPSAEAAQGIDQKIWNYWLHPTDTKLAGLMDKALRTHAGGDIMGAIGQLESLVKYYPDYAEAWNQLATYKYELGRLDASLADCERVLAIEPRHFGALSGKVLIELRQGKHAQALRDMEMALQIHPFLSEKALFPELNQPITRA